MARITVKTLADAVGVSPSTVSNAYNRPDQLSPDLRARILATAAELGYAGPDAVARSLRSGKAGAVGVLLTERLSYAFSDPYAIGFLAGLSEVVERQPRQRGVDAAGARRRGAGRHRGPAGEHRRDDPALHRQLSPGRPAGALARHPPGGHPRRPRPGVGVGGHRRRRGRRPRRSAPGGPRTPARGRHRRHPSSGRHRRHRAAPRHRSPASTAPPDCVA